MIYLRAAMTALGAAGLLTKVLVGLGLVAALLTAYGIWHHQIYQSGYDRALSDIARNDSKAVGRASNLRTTYETCNDRKGSWDQTTGRCR
jgi:hypothetical protein